MDFAMASSSRTAQWLRAWDLLFAISTRDIVLRYRGTALGYVWWVARPFTLGLLLWFALGKVLALDIPNYHLFIMTGLFPWFWFSSAVSEGSNVLVSYGALIKKVIFPRIILPLSAAIGGAVQFSLTLPILILFILVAGGGADPVWIIGIPMLILLQLALTLGIGMTLSPLNVFLRDVSPLIDVGLTVLFYSSAVIFPLERVPDSVRPLLLINPLTSLMEGWRSVLLRGTFPGPEIWSAVGLTAVFCVAGFAIFRKLERHVGDAL